MEGEARLSWKWISITDREKELLAHAPASCIKKRGPYAAGANEIPAPWLFRSPFEAAEPALDANVLYIIAAHEVLRDSSVIDWPEKPIALIDTWMAMDFDDALTMLRGKLALERLK